MHRRHRVGSGSLIRRIYEQGVRVPARGVMLTGMLEPSGGARVAVVASKKVGPAVERNLARRRLRAAARPLMSQVEPGAHAVLVATRATGRMDFQKLSEDVRRAFVKAGLLVPGRA